ncbi:MFS transporter [Actinomadura sp. BRA 177]|uniref:MFS transporter n=1 Tax=Actinomadura sp. BRA 177 TaxID=2745202 RepID=UPI001C3CFF82|nr:MFS transporter [Actinomadura sp. BRA 177]
MAGRRLSGVPLRGSYPAAVAMALLALCPFIVLSTASLLLRQPLMRDLGGGMFGAQLAGGLSNAGYSFGAVAAADLIQRVPGRLFLTCEAGFVAGSLLAALAPGIALFTAGRVVQGAATGMLLVAALPPLVTNHGAEKLPLTAAFVNLGLFGMVTLGPLVGGIAEGFAAWRALFIGTAVLGVIGLLIGALAFERAEPPSRRIGFDYSAIPVAAAATVLPFFGVSWLSRGSFTSIGFLLPVILGLLALGTLMVRQYRKPRALMPLKLLAHTLPVTGVSIAMVAGAGFTTLIELAVIYLLDVAHRPPMETGALLATQIAGLVAAAWLFKTMLTTRWLPALAFTGTGLVAAGGALLLWLPPVPVIAVAGALLGFGAGAGVAPGLFMAGLSVPSNRLGPTFALVELLRAEAAFLIGPVLVHIAMLSDDLAQGIRLTILIMVLIVLAGAVVLLGLLLAGSARPHAPDLRSWLAGESPAYHSPRLGAAFRGQGPT